MFEHNHVYKRSDIHDQYGGSRRGGISTCARFPFIFIFSDKSGKKHGYIDRWENEDIFSYSGEGRFGDMKMIKGNLALKNHLQRRKRVFLFYTKGDTFATYDCELDLVDIGYFDGYDTDNNPRIGIKFFFKRVGSEIDYVNSSRAIMLDPMDDFRIVSKPNETERKGLINSRVGQGAYRKSILYRWKFRCAVTRYNKPDILIASHIVAWENANDDERLDVDNGILLSPNYDALFDQNLISFENDGKIILSDKLLDSNYNELGVTGRERIKDLTDANIKYLERHREVLLRLN